MTAGETRLNIVVLGACWGISKPLTSINISLLPHHPAVPTRVINLLQGGRRGSLEFIEAIDYIFPAMRMWMEHVKSLKRRQDILWFWLVAEASMKTCSCECVLGCPIKVDGWGDLYLALYDSCYLAQTCYSERCRSLALILILLQDTIKCSCCGAVTVNTLHLLS